ncbi:MAG: DNA mismatch repair protein MutS [Gammaproteobacteria bacterium]|nr:MAG: DNA mismatch repair protein MutS [Gammaproteobacteria bacterium]
MSSFQSLLGGDSVKKIRGDDKSPDFYRKKPQVSAEKRQLAESFEHAAISQTGYDIGIEDEMSYRANGVQKQVLKQLAKGEIPPYESIDLHGMTTLEAEVYMATTIDNQRYHHKSCLRIVHGKGYNVGDSPDNKPVPKLKNFTARYLSEHPRVLAFASCPPNRGGTGAVYVLLSRFDSVS